MPKTYYQAPTHLLKFYEEAVIGSEARTAVETHFSYSKLTTRKIETSQKRRFYTSNVLWTKNKNPNWNETKHHLNINKLLCVFSYFTVIWIVIYNVKTQYITGFQFEGNFVKTIWKGMTFFYIEIID